MKKQTLKLESLSSFQAKSTEKSRLFNAFGGNNSQYDDVSSSSDNSTDNDASMSGDNSATNDNSISSDNSQIGSDLSSDNSDNV